MSGLKNRNSICYVLLPVILILAVFLFSGCSALTYSENNELEIPAEFTGIYKEALTSPLEKAISETNDVELAQFSQKLLDGYQLTQIENNGDEAGSIAGLLPDIRYINQVAMETTLIEAGKTLQDPELSEFYSSFINRIGINH